MDNQSVRMSSSSLARTNECNCDKCLNPNNIKSTHIDLATLSLKRKQSTAVTICMPIASSLRMLSTLHVARCRTCATDCLRITMDINLSRTAWWWRSTATTTTSRHRRTATTSRIRAHSLRLIAAGPGGTHTASYTGRRHGELACGKQTKSFH